MTDMDASRSHREEQDDLGAGMRRQMEAKVEERVEEELLTFFGGLLTQIGERLSAFLGEAATIAIFAAARREAARIYPFLEKMDVGAKGLCLDGLKESHTPPGRATMQAGLLAFIDSLIGIVTDLTGDILLDKVQPFVQELKQKLEEN